MDIEKDLKQNIAFVLTKKDLTKFNELAKDFLGADATLPFLCFCRDDTNRTWHSVTQVLEYENSRKRAIYNIFIVALSVNRKKKLKIDLGKSESWASIEIRLSGDDMSESTLDSYKLKFEEACEGMKPWYSWLATVNLGMVFTVLSFLWAAILVVRYFARGDPAGDFFKGSVHWGVVVIQVMIFWAVMALTSLLRSLVFPRATFAIGQGERRFQKMEIWRLVFLAGIAINLATGVLLAVLL